MAIINDFDWVELDFDGLPLTIGSKYMIMDGNVWNKYTYLGYDPKHRLDDFSLVTYEVHVFKSKHGTSYKSVKYMKELFDHGRVRVYSDDFSFYNELGIKKVTIEELQPNFVMVFKDGVDVKNTKVLQKRLFEMGYQWHNNGNKLLRNKNVKHKLYTIESINWDTSNYLYSGMSPTFGDNKIMMVSTLEGLHSEWEKEMRLNFIYQHPNITVIDGDYLLSKL